MAEPPRTATGRISVLAYPELAAEWDYEANTLDPAEVSFGSDAVIWWRCPDCERPYRQVVNRRVRGRDCPRWKLHHNSLADRYPEIAVEWHPIKNKALTPADVQPGADMKMWWQCQECGHEWQARIANRTRLGRGCPHWRCHGGNTLAERRPELAAEWHPTLNGPLRPSDVPPSHASRVWWLCSLCGCAWQATPAKRSEKKGGGCPKRLFHHGNTLAERYPELAAEWHPSLNDALTPFDLAPQANQKVWWLCAICGHAWPASLNARVGGGSGCPDCDRWSVGKVARVLADLHAAHGSLLALDGCDREQLLDEVGLLGTACRGRVIVEALRANHLEAADYAAFLAEPGAADALIERLLADPELLAAAERLRPPIPASLRRSTLARDSRHCCLCGASDRPLHIDHFVPHSRGGPTVRANLWTLCETCNRLKSFKLPEDVPGVVVAWLRSGRTLPAGTPAPPFSDPQAPTRPGEDTLRA